MTTVTKKLENLRRMMVNHSVDFYYVPTRDDHNNEYVPVHWQRRQWLTYFSGSYGDALVGLENAYLWTDARYYLQAEQELDLSEFQLMRQLQGVSAPIAQWLGENAFNATVAVDPKVISMQQQRQWSAVLLRVHGALTAVSENWIDAIWEDRPLPEAKTIRVLDVAYAGLDASEKLTHLRLSMKTAGADVLVISQLDEIAWLFNIRGSDIPFNPVVISYAIVTRDEATLFVNLNAIAQSDLSYFAEQNLHWLHTHWRNNVDEISAADQLEKMRREEKKCVDLSFPTICGFADHGAIVHYHAAPETKHVITDQAILLLDSGGQYYEGTTDITRTIHLGTPTADEKKHYTLVLKGHLALRHTPFPDGACGEHINTLARMALWAHGMDFGHGTGHGVGCYLCVHEGPQRIGYGASGVPLKPGMVVSNEPGLYFSGQYGIRIENLCEIVEVISKENSPTDSGAFYSMADLTLVPYAKELIDKTLLSAQEIKWIDEYHQHIVDVLLSDLPVEVGEWLQAVTKPL